MLWIPMAIGAVAGALANKDNPLKGAAMGAGMGALGGAGMAAMGGGIGAMGGGGLLGSAGGGTGATLGGGLLGGGSFVPAAAEAAPSMWQTALSYAKPVGEAMQAASSAKSLLSTPPRPIQASPFTPPMPNNTLGQMVSGFGQDQQLRNQMDQEMRMRRRQMFRGGV